MELKDIFIQNLRKFRKFKKISQMTLAERCDTSTSYIGQIEIGNRFPSMELVDKIAIALDIKPYLLFYDDLDEKIKKMPPPAKSSKISDSVKNEIIKNLTDAVRKLKNLQK